MAFTCKFCECDFDNMLDLNVHQGKTGHTGLGEQSSIMPLTKGLIGDAVGIYGWFKKKGKKK